MGKKTHEMQSIFGSFEWLLKERLTSIDNMTRAMQKEMATMGVTNAEIAAYLPEQFKRIAQEVIEQQQNRYDRKENEHGPSHHSHKKQQNPLPSSKRDGYERVS